MGCNAQAYNYVYCCAHVAWQELQLNGPHIRSQCMWWAQLGYKLVIKSEQWQFTPTFYRCKTMTKGTTHWAIRPYVFFSSPSCPSTYKTGRCVVCCQHPISHTVFLDLRKLWCGWGLQRLRLGFLKKANTGTQVPMGFKNSSLTTCKPYVLVTRTSGTQEITGWGAGEGKRAFVPSNKNNLFPAWSPGLQSLVVRLYQVPIKSQMEKATEKEWKKRRFLPEEINSPNYMWTEKEARGEKETRPPPQ